MSRLVSRFVSRLVVKIFVKIVVIASPSTSNVSIFQPRYGPAFVVTLGQILTFLAHLLLLPPVKIRIFAQNMLSWALIGLAG